MVEMMVAQWRRFTSGAGGNLWFSIIVYSRGDGGLGAQIIAVLVYCFVVYMVWYKWGRWRGILQMVLTLCDGGVAFNVTTKGGIKVNTCLESV